MAATQPPGSPRALIGRSRGTESSQLNNVVNALCFACPFPERGTNWQGSARSEPDALNAPERACNRFPGVALLTRRRWRQPSAGV
jgi:hypothetical protein